MIKCVHHMTAMTRCGWTGEWADTKSLGICPSCGHVNCFVKVTVMPMPANSEKTPDGRIVKAGSYVCDPEEAPK